MSLRQLTIMIVDDDKFMQDAIVMLIKHLKHNLIVARSGSEALQIITTTKVDLIISDIQMPDGTGISLLEEIRRLSPRLPIVHLMTGETSISETDLLKKGASGVLLKPFKKQQLVDIIGDAMNNAALL